MKSTIKNTYISNYLSKLSNLFIDFHHEDFLKIIQCLKEIKRNNLARAILAKAQATAIAA